ncbi:MAG: metallophosphoesterase [Propionibacteriaceae bacterium]
MATGMAIIPDTQIMAARHPELYRGIGDWLVARAGAEGIGAVLHVGDVVHHGAAKPEQFHIARAVHQRIVDAGLPLFVAIGNHDYDDMLHGPIRSLTHFTDQVASTRHAGADWMTGSYGGDGANCFGLVALAETKMLILVLEFCPEPAVVAWAEDVLRGYPDHVAVVNTHGYLDGDGTMTRPGSPYHPDLYPAIHDGYDGAALWQVLRRHANVRAVFCGHQIPQTISYRVDAAADGHGVLASFQNWQSTEHGGGGRIRIVRWSDQGRTVSMQVLNTATGDYEHDPGYDVTLNLDSDIGTLFSNS